MRVANTSEKDFEERLICESVSDLKCRYASMVYCFSEYQAQEIAKKYGKPCEIKKLDENIWEVCKVEHRLSRSGK